MVRAMGDPIDGFLTSYDPAVGELAQELRRLVGRLVPEAEEKLHRPWKVIAYGRGRKFCAIAPHKSWVNLQFHGGAGLPDPDGLLTGTGKSMRHVKVASSRDLKRKALAKLIRAAAAEAG